MRSAWLASLALFVLLLAGCGDSDSDDGGAAPRAATESPEQETSAPEGLSHEELVARLNKLCTDLTADRRRAEPEADRLEEARDYKGLADFYDEQRQATDEEFTSNVEALQPSSQDRDAFERFLQAVKDQNRLDKRYASAVRGQAGGATPRPVRALTTVVMSIGRNSQAHDIAARDLGTDKCGPLACSK